MTDPDILSTNLFKEIGRRPKWTAPCTFDRTNAMPLDNKTCFLTYADLESYINEEESTAYPGMFVSVTSTSDPQNGAYVLMSDGTKLNPVPLGDSKQVNIDMEGVATVETIDQAQYTLRELKEKYNNLAQQFNNLVQAIRNATPTQEVPE